MEISGSVHADWAQLDQCVEKSLRKPWKILQLTVTEEKNAALNLHLVYSLEEITVKISLELCMSNTLVKVQFFVLSFVRSLVISSFCTFSGPSERN